MFGMLVESRDFGSVARLVTPGLLIALTAATVRAMCGGIEQHRTGARNVPGRPPNWVFGIVWPVLYVCVGLAWRRAPRKLGLDWRFAALIGLCCAWLYVYSCASAKRMASAILLATTLIAASVIRSAYKANVSEVWSLLLPFTLWVAFATYLNVYEAFLQN